VTMPAPSDTTRADVPLGQGPGRNVPSPVAPEARLRRDGGVGRGGSACGLSTPSAGALAHARAALEAVTDPELPFLTIADMGILRDVRLAADGKTVEVAITPTYSGCPAMDAVALDIASALAKAGFPGARIERVLSPAWTTDWLSPAAREKLRANGIAPPEGDQGRARGKRALFAETAVACPMCGSAETERVSEFGSTACKASYRCRACREPFQYFKCI
jgi:ring-1,2-phenylacetyl-CoA epoxidase subunit PaaD